MIVWINGAFGVGKTTTAGLVTKRLDGAKVFDPEYVGYMLMPFVDSPTGDFQDLPLWRHLVIQIMTGLAHQHPRTWDAPMSLVNAAYRSEIFDGIRAAGVDLREVILTLPEQQLRTRIDTDQVDTKARRWRQDHVTHALTTFASLTDALLHRPPSAREASFGATFTESLSGNRSGGLGNGYRSSALISECRADVG